jgi:beta-glucanase (GH16 family)
MATLSAPAGYTSSNLVFQDSFNGTTLGSVWHPYITSRAANGWPWNDNGSGGSGVGGPYDADYNTAEQVAVSNGLLTLTAEKESIYGVNQGSWETFPITSGAISSYGNFEFKGGYLQISMKAPSGDGAWPGLWLLPGAGATTTRDTFEIDIQEGGYTGSGPANQAFSWHLHTPSGTVGGVVDTGVDLTADFHTYGINWVPGQSITWYLDGRQIARVTSAQVPIPNEPMELILSHQVADSDATGWHTTLDSSTPQAMQMQVDEIQLYQLPNSGNTVTGANVTASGDQTIDGGGGKDTITFNFALTQAIVTYSDNTVTIEGPGTKTVLTGFERFVFNDGTVDNADGSPLVDDLYYYTRHHDVWAANVDADVHYAVFGWHEGRNPNAFFDTEGYLATYGDVKAAGVNPLQHYDQFGWKEGRDPSPAFDTHDYLATYTDVAAAKIDPLAHFLIFGMQEGRHAFGDGLWT